MDDRTVVGPERFRRVWRRPRWTVRLRLTLLYGALFLVTGALLLAVTYELAAHALPLLGVKPPAPPDLTLPINEPPVPTPGADSRQRTEDLRQYLVASALGLAIMTFVSAGLGWMMAGRMLRPLRTMTASARAISASDLHQRLDVQGPDDEIKDLADTFDGLLGRLEAAFEAQRRFVANASHELRTPLTFERSLLEVALADPDATATALRATCQRVLTNNQQQEQLIEALLILARSQRGLDRREDLDLGEIAGTFLGAARAEASSHGLRVEADLNPAPTSGDPRLVERLVANLLDNALRHNVTEGQANIWTGAHAGRPTVLVTNTGLVIPPDQLDTLFQPFQRLDATRISGAGGVGLGLSIIAAIAEAHEAEIDAEALPKGGLSIRISFGVRS